MSRTLSYQAMQELAGYGYSDKTISHFADKFNAALESNFSNGLDNDEYESAMEDIVMLMIEEDSVDDGDSYMENKVMTEWSFKSHFKRHYKDAYYVVEVALNALLSSGVVNEHPPVIMSGSGKNLDKVTLPTSYSLNLY